MPPKANGERRRKHIRFDENGRAPKKKRPDRLERPAESAVKPADIFKRVQVSALLSAVTLYRGVAVVNTTRLEEVLRQAPTVGAPSNPFGKWIMIRTYVQFLSV